LTKECVTLACVPDWTLPSPKSNFQSAMVPSGSPEPLPSKVRLSPVLPPVEQEMTALGYWLLVTVHPCRRGRE
jgi:hypothetical protein